MNCEANIPAGSVIRMGWGDVAIIQVEKLYDFSTLFKQADTSPPELIAASDDSCSDTEYYSDSEESSSSADEALVETTLVTESAASDDSYSNTAYYSDSEESSSAADAILIETTLVAETVAKKVKRVKFTNVQVREYSLTLGDHPMSGMYPLSLDWAFVASEPVTMDHYEENRKPAFVSNSVRRGINVPHLTLRQRCYRLIEVTGCTDEEIQRLNRQRQAQVREEKKRASLERPTLIY